MSAIEAALLDIDRTLVDEQGQLYPGLEGPLDPETRPFAATFITGRGYPRYRQAAEENPQLWAYGMPIGLENGGRIVDGTTFDNLLFSPLTADEHDAARDYILSESDVRFVSFHPRAARTKTLIWTPHEAEATKMQAAWSRNADVFVGGYSDLFAAISQADPCMLTVKTFGAPTNEPDGSLRINQNGTTRNIVTKNADKGTAGLIIADMMGVDLERTLAAGDDPADLPMLTLPGLGYPVAVGGGWAHAHEAQLPPTAIRVEHPMYLGSLISELVERP